MKYSVFRPNWFRLLPCIAFAWLAAAITAAAGSGTPTLRFLWVGSPGVGVVMLHSSSEPTGPVAALSAWRLSPPIAAAEDALWSVTIDDGPQLPVQIAHAESQSLSGERVVFVWLNDSQPQAVSAVLPPGRRGGLYLLNLTDLPLHTRCGDWTGLLTPAQLLFRQLPGAGTGDVGVAFAIRQHGRMHLLFSTTLSVREDDRTLIVVGPAPDSSPIPRRIPTRRINL